MATKQLKKLLLCDSCGIISEDVKLSVDPYSLELNDESVEMNLCEECYTERLMDI
jgi:hypothetical protein